MAEQVFFSINVDTGKPIKTIGELKANTKALTKELDNTKIGTKRFNELKTSLTANKEASKNLNREINKTRPLADSIKEGVSGLSSQIRVFGVSIGAIGNQAKAAAVGMVGLNKATTGGAKAMRVLKIAIAATGIGLLLIALGSLVAFFTKTKRGADLLAQGTAALGIVFDKLIDLASSLGEFLVKAFQNPQQALKDFGEGIKNFVLRRIEDIMSGVRGLGNAFSLLFEGKFTEAAEAAGDAAADLLTGLNPIAGAIKDSSDAIGEFADEIAEAAKRAADLESQLQKLADTENAFIVIRARLNDQVRKLRLDAKDENKTNAERLQALDEAIAKEKEIADQAVVIAEEAFRINSEQLKQSNNLREDEKKNFELEAAVLNARAAGNKKILTLQSERLGLLNKLTKEEEKKEKDRLKKIADRNKEEEERLKSVLLQANINAQEDFKNKIITQEEFDARMLENQKEFLMASMAFAEEGSIAKFELQAKINDLEIAQNKGKLDQISADEKKAAEEEKERNETRQEVAAITAATITSILLDNNASTITSLKEFGKQIAIILVEQLERLALAKIAEATLREVGTKGFVGIGTAAVLVGILKGAVGVAKGLILKAQDGMEIQGPSHAGGGVPIMAPGGMIEAEGGEKIINKRSSAMFHEQLSAINVAGGGKKFANGGAISGIPSIQTPQIGNQQQVLNALRSLTLKSVVSVSEINEVNNKVEVIDNLNTL